MNREPWTVAEEARKHLKTQPALGIAWGESITARAPRNEVPLRSATRWLRDSKVRRAVEAWRRRAPANLALPGYRGVR